MRARLAQHADLALRTCSSTSGPMCRAKCFAKDAGSSVDAPWRCTSPEIETLPACPAVLAPTYSFQNKRHPTSRRTPPLSVALLGSGPASSPPARRWRRREDRLVGRPALGRLRAFANNPAPNCCADVSPRLDSVVHRHEARGQGELQLFHGDSRHARLSVETFDPAVAVGALPDQTRVWITHDP